MSPKAGEKKPKFAENERVLCYQGPLIYEAKCLKADLRKDDKYFYFIHYSGWKKHWDEWVQEGRILKYNDTNLQKQKDLLKRCGKDKKKSSKKDFKPIKNEKEHLDKRKLTDTPHSGSSVQQPSVEPENKKAYIASVEEDIICENCYVHPSLTVTIPKSLYPLLANDWELICRRKQLFHIPAKISVHVILKKYMENSVSRSEGSSIKREMTSGIQEYFNVMLGSQLLYKFERPQYGDALEKYPNYTVSQLYGAFHLLRFFVRIGSVLSSQNFVKANSMKLILYYVHDCLSFLQHKREEFFDVNEYEIVPAEYHRRAIT